MMFDGNLPVLRPDKKFTGQAGAVSKIRKIRTEADLRALANESKKGNLHKYSRQDIEFIRENYLTMDHHEIARRLGRTKAAIVTKANALGLQKRGGWSR